MRQQPRLATKRLDRLIIAGEPRHEIEVHDPVFLVDAARPSSGECVTEVLGLPGPREWVTGNGIVVALTLIGRLLSSGVDASRPPGEQT